MLSFCPVAHTPNSLNMRNGLLRQAASALSVINGQAFAQRQIYTTVIISLTVSSLQMCLLKTVYLMMQSSEKINQGIPVTTHLKGIEIKNALIVCKAFHARRCLMLYQMAFPDVEIKVCPIHCYNITKDNWYKSEQGINRVLGELTRCGNQVVEDMKEYLL